MSKFAVTLKRLMENRKISPKMVSEATQIPSSTLSEWVSGERTPRLSDSILNLARFFGVSIEFLLTGSEPEARIINELIDIEEDEFISIHRGVYRINVEKFTGRKTKKEK